MAEDILIPLGGMVLSGRIIYTVIAGIQNWYRRRTGAIFQSKISEARRSGYCAVSSSGGGTCIESPAI